MKTLVLLLVLISSATARDLTFQVLAESAPASERVGLLLDTYDAFSAAIERGDIAIGETHASRSLRGASISVELPQLKITLSLPGELTAPQERDLSNALTVAALLASEARMIDAVEALRVKAATLSRTIETERNPARRAILQRMLTATIPPLDGPRTPFLVRSN